MGAFRESVLSMCWVGPILTGLFFWVVTLTTFMPPNSSVLSPSTSPGPSEDDCTADKLRSNVLMSMRWMAMFAISEMIVLFTVRWFVETLAGEETKAFSLDEEPLKIARKELKEAEAELVVAEKAFQDTPTQATNDDQAKALKRNDKCTSMVEACEANLKVGLARVPTFRRRVVRSAYCLVIGLSFAMSFFSAKAFYYSLRLQIGCLDQASEIAPFVVVGILSVGVHVQTFLVAITRD